VNPYLQKSFPFDPLTALAPINTPLGSAIFLAVHPSVPASNVAELVEHARKNPGKLKLRQCWHGVRSSHRGRRIEELAETIEGCRKFLLMSKIAVAVGGLLSLAMAFGVIWFDATVMIAAITAVIGGAVLLGSNSSTWDEKEVWHV
jgi:hypothetical protein